MSNSQFSNLKSILASRYRELGGLAVFLLLFYAAIGWSNRTADAEVSKDVNASRMSKARVYSDIALRRSDFTDAIVHLEDVLVADPHNSHARFRLALCYRNKFILAYFQDSDSALGRSNITLNEPSESEWRSIHIRAVELYRRCTKSHRYRGTSLFEIAKLYGMVENRKETLAALNELLDLNYQTNIGISRALEFAFLLEDPKFQELVAQEERQRQRHGRR